MSLLCAECAIAAEETVFHIISECRVHAQTEYKGRHDKLAKVIHRDLCKKYGVKVQSKWYDHVPEKVRRNGPCQDSLGLHYPDRSCYIT